MAQKFPFFIEGPGGGRPALYRLWFGKRYFIWKGKSLQASVEQNMTDLYRLYNRPELPPETNNFYRILAHIRRHPIRRCLVEVILKSDDVEQLVRTEAKLLKAGQQDPLCLNITFEPYIPKWIVEARNKPAVQGIDSLRMTIEPEATPYDVKVTLLRPGGSNAAAEVKTEIPGLDDDLLHALTVNDAG